METLRTVFSILKHISYCPVQVSATSHNTHNCYISEAYHIFKFSYGFARPTSILSVTTLVDLSLRRSSFFVMKGLHPLYYLHVLNVFKYIKVICKI